MKRTRTRLRRRLKLVLTILAALAGGAALIALSTWMRPPEAAPSGGTSTTAPASAPAVPMPPVDPRTASAQNVSGVLLLFGLACLLVAVVFTLLLVVDIRKSRPAWRTQQRYPKRR